MAGIDAVGFLIIVTFFGMSPFFFAIYSFTFPKWEIYYIYWKDYIKRTLCDGNTVCFWFIKRIWLNEYYCTNYRLLPPFKIS